jgi:hypothetical protein
MQGREENKMTQKQTSNAHLNGTAEMQRTDPEVVPKAQRRSFTGNDRKIQEQFIDERLCQAVSHLLMVTEPLVAAAMDYLEGRKTRLGAKW